MPQQQNDLTFFTNLNQGFEILTHVKERQYRYNDRQLVYQHDKVKLYHYSPKTEKTISPPLLVVFATVNRPEILDLFPEKSFIGALLENGVDVYLLDWGYPDINDQQISFNQYVSEYLHLCVQHIQRTTKQNKISLLGICQGGLICLCYAILSPNNLHKLVLISTPIDFHTDDNMISHCISKIEFDHVLKITGGNVPGDWLTQFFINLRPFELIGQKYLRFMDNLNDKVFTDRFLQVEKWLHDAPDQTGLAFKEFVENFYQQNNLIKNKIVIEDKKIDLHQLHLPILNVMAKEDEIVPMSASRPLSQYVDEQYYTEAVFPSGHIGIYVSDKVGKTMSKTIAEWLGTESPADETA